MAESQTSAVVLDTHVWLWLTQGEGAQLGLEAIEQIEVASRNGKLFVSAISVWEVAMLEARKRISLSRPVDDWVRAALRAPGTHLLPLTPEIAIESTRLPGFTHVDPADRILIASARVAGARLATRDRAIIEYSTLGHLAAIDARP